MGSDFPGGGGDKRIANYKVFIHKTTMIYFFLQDRAIGGGGDNFSWGGMNLQGKGFQGEARIHFKY